MKDDEFLAAIIEAPDDDAPRLMYADWLEEHGDPRGMLIRVQRERAKIDDRDPRCIELEYQERRLLAKHRNAWARPLRKWGRNIEFYRGFVERITLSAETFLNRGKSLLAAAPIREVKLMRLKEQVEAVAACPLLSRLSSLSLRDCKLGLARLKKFLTSKWLGGLQGIDFSFNGLSVSGVREIVACDALQQVTSLGLDSCGLAAEGLELLLDSDLISGVEELQLRSNNIDNKGARQLATSSGLGNLRTLVLEFNREITALGARALLESELLCSLQRLSLRHCGLSDHLSDVFCESAQHRDLLALNLDHNFLDSHGVQRLAHSSCLSGLIDLRLELNGVENEDLRALIEVGDMRHLRTLRLPFNHLNHAGAEILAQWDGAARLTSLDLSGNSLGDEGVATLAGAENLRNLNILDLTFTEMSDRGAQALAESTTLDRLTELRVTAKARDHSWQKVPGISSEVKKMLTKRFGRHVCYFD